MYLDIEMHYIKLLEVEMTLLQPATTERQPDLASGLSSPPPRAGMTSLGRRIALITAVTAIAPMTWGTT